MNKDPLALKSQLCFPLYACAKEIVRAYQPFLEGLDLTYTQYIVMMVLWEHKQMNVKALGEYLYLDSGTLTPLLRKMEAKGFLTRERSKRDERTVIITITEKGEALHEKAGSIPCKMAELIDMPQKDFETMYTLLYEMLEKLTGHTQKQ